MLRSFSKVIKLSITMSKPHLFTACDIGSGRSMSRNMKRIPDIGKWRIDVRLINPLASVAGQVARRF